MKLFFSVIAVLLTFVAFVPYIKSILAGKTRPHIFSWIIWGLTTTIVFLAQLQAGGGLGAWPTGISGLVTFYIAWLAFQTRADVTITPTDWFFFFMALAAIPLWYVTSDPTWAVVVLTTVDLLGFGPTIRKAWLSPYDESLLFFTVFMVRSVFSVFALEAFSLATLLFPIAIAAGCGMLLLVVACRRKSLKNSAG